MEKLFNRSDRIAQELQKKIAAIIQHSLKDPRIKTIITVSEVQVSKDLSYAQIFVSFLESDNNEKVKKKITILNRASSYIRKLLCKRMKLRIVPNIIFHHDDSFLKGNKISCILENLTKKE
ncbi:30S ribosome-binding factor RbfA [Buchnera aphidicola]|uniref:Ribosome-binding factor A n=2 Tax=Buchnera aphidicola TaxID=9 RepID=RBFA_BUCAI|nr:30S ribosome-binding factor RbfA [Buchnera aphidicola]B8D9G1.1 RecName: Full=Ribosome-binding factor A [Buchnera aphidicola str. 5A (Acyrthosiphon pisum)]P57457.1 RecName: Full=Ribosome-binding factor A [Buchnera aphidicola str. APS (Acyrthosiphon pisum)]pir/H84973/ ribosome-binding factor A [imported] - Buchnera sp. (strain APS) [Buchnera sp. (in: enterobacteria)]ACL30732.1 ribosome-binding factor A [Buchnera aphidicola str. 5A (Acyrthosiphon pisum)]BAB13080.1 ribosome-binding factor A [Bu